MLEVIDEEPLFDKTLLELAQWVSGYYKSSLGEAMGIMLPSALSAKRRGSFKLGKDAGQDPSVNENQNLVLNERQTLALSEIKNSIDKNKFSVFLLYGVAGSGKTEVYLRSIEHCISKGKNVLMLIPEISLTQQTITRFLQRFSDEKIALLHSRLAPREKLGEWVRIKKGEAEIVIGPRSAVFAPVNNLGLVIIDEEHESAYKEHSTPRYNARQVAYWRAMNVGGILLLGSATPSIETYYLCQEKKFRMLNMPERIHNKNIPDIEIVDMRKEYELISEKLLQEIKLRLDKKEQVIIFLNRRGWANYIVCSDCGYIFYCRDCNISLTYHRENGKSELLCHYCGYHTQAPDLCPACKSVKLKLAGSGTQKIELLMKEKFKDAVIERFDLDTTTKKDAHWDILERFLAGKIDILVGTQMIAKGLHFPNVTLVGIISADSILNLPDFRTRERAFALITQVAGRAGREMKKGEVIIQTYNPESEVIKMALSNNYDSFYKNELELRKMLSYPPFKHILKLLIRGRDEAEVIKASDELLSGIKKSLREKVEILGPVQAPISKISKNFRWQIILKGDKFESLYKSLEEFKLKHQDTYLEIDVDPVSLL